MLKVYSILLIAVLLILLDTVDGNSSFVSSYSSQAIPSADVSSTPVLDLQLSHQLLSTTLSLPMISNSNGVTTHIGNVTPSKSTPTTEHTVSLSTSNNSVNNSNNNTTKSSIPLPLWAWAVFVVSGTLVLSSSLILVTLLGARRRQRRGSYDTTTTHEHQTDGIETETETERPRNGDVDGNMVRQQNLSAEEGEEDGIQCGNANSSTITHESTRRPSGELRGGEHTTTEEREGEILQLQTSAVHDQYDFDTPTFSTFRRKPREGSTHTTNKQQPAAAIRGGMKAERGVHTDNPTELVTLATAMDLSDIGTGYSSQTL